MIAQPDKSTAAKDGATVCFCWSGLCASVCVSVEEWAMQWGQISLGSGKASLHRVKFLRANSIKSTRFCDFFSGTDIWRCGSFSRDSGQQPATIESHCEIASVIKLTVIEAKVVVIVVSSFSTLAFLRRTTKLQHWSFPKYGLQFLLL